MRQTTVSSLTPARKCPGKVSEDVVFRFSHSCDGPVDDALGRETIVAVIIAVYRMLVEIDAISYDLPVTKVMNISYF